MALKHFALIFLFTLFFSSSLHETEARDGQMFNKIPSKTNEVEVDEVKQPQQNLPKSQETSPTFTPENQEDEQPNVLPQNTLNNNNNKPIQVNPNPNYPYNAKYLPKNYNTVAYVTQPEDFNEGYTNTPTNNNNFQDQESTQNYYNAQKHDMNNEFNFMNNEEGTSVNDDNNKYYNNEASNNFKNENSYYNNENFNARFVDTSETTNDNNNNDDNFSTRFMDASETTNNNDNNNDDNNNYYSSGKSRVNRVEPQGMSDTRFMENGKYNYDIVSRTYSRDHPYVNPMAMRNQYNNYNGEEGQYKNEENMP